MSLVALIGDCTTTTAIAIAAAWPVDGEVFILEADRTGGSLAGWLDTPPTPSLTTLVAARGSRPLGESVDGVGRQLRWNDVAHGVQNSASGVRFIAAPVRSREAALAIAEAERALIPMLAELDERTVLVDVGRHAAADLLPQAVLAATNVVVLHRQDPAAANAAAVRLDRLVENLEQLASIRGQVVLAVIGHEPYDLSEIAEFVSSKSSTTIASAHSIAYDPLSASVLAGRAGVSAKRLARLPLARSVAQLTAELVPTSRAVPTVSFSRTRGSTQPANGLAR